MINDARKHFEAVVNDLALLMRLDRADLREDVKGTLRRHQSIKVSTTELSEAQLEFFADRLQQYKVDIDMLPPEERPFDLDRILFRSL